MTNWLERNYSTSALLYLSLFKILPYPPGSLDSISVFILFKPIKSDLLLCVIYGNKHFISFEFLWNKYSDIWLPRSIWNTKLPQNCDSLILTLFHELLFLSIWIFLEYYFYSMVLLDLLCRMGWLSHLDWASEMGQNRPGLAKH